MRRVMVVGTSGAGKTTIAVRLARRLGVPHVELDALFHGPGWRPRELDDFRRAVAAATADGGWVVDGNYRSVQDIVTARADTVVWIDLPRALVMWQVVSRTLARIALRRELWNGNRERWRNLATLDPNESVVLWAWTTHGAVRRRYEACAAGLEWAHLRVVRVRSRADAARLLRSAPDG